MIQGQKVTLRTVMEKDLETLYALLSDVKNRGPYTNWDLPTQASHLKQYQENCFWGETTGTLQISAHASNIPSKRVAEKCGFKFEGILREATFTHGKYQDTALYSLLRSEVNPL